MNSVTLDIKSLQFVTCRDPEPSTDLARAGCPTLPMTGACAYRRPTAGAVEEEASGKDTLL